MPSIARKLCDEIVDPAMVVTPTINSLKKSKVYHNSSNSIEDRSTRTVTVQKRRVINKIVPRDSSKNSVINQYKSKNILYKKNFTDIGVNTRATGPLRCDTNCMTLVRKRENGSSCKCSATPRKSNQKIQKSNIETNAKEIQAFASRHFKHDKAVAQVIASSSFGMQFVGGQTNNNNGINNNNLSNSIGPDSKLKKTVGYKFSNNTNRNTVSNRSAEISKIGEHLSYQQKTTKRVIENNNSDYFSSFYGTLGNTKRWALTRYPTKGPDF